MVFLPRDDWLLIIFTYRSPMDVKKLSMKASLLANEALRRWYPVHVISETYSIYTVDINWKSIHFRTTDCGLCLSFAYKICKSKIFTNLFLSHYNLNIPFYRFYSLGDEIDLTGLSFPLVVKPHDGSCNRGVTIDIQNTADFKMALEYAYKYSDKVVVQKYVEGDLYRVFVLWNQVAALTRLDPPSIVWDGISTINQLIVNENEVFYRWKDKLSPAKPILIEDQLHAFLNSWWYTLDSILPIWKKIFLRKNPQMSLGGISTNVSFSSDLFGDCIKAAELLWLPWAGIDIIAKDDSFSDYSIIEVNSQPDFKMHMYPSYWEPIDIASMLMDLIEKHYV